MEKHMFDEELADLHNLLYTYCDCFPEDKEAEILKARVLDLFKAQTGKTKTRIVNRRNAGRKPKVTEEQIETIKTARAIGATYQEIADKTGLSLGTIHRILNPYSYK